MEGMEVAAWTVAQKVAVNSVAAVSVGQTEAAAAISSFRAQKSHALDLQQTSPSGWLRTKV